MYDNQQLCGCDDITYTFLEQTSPYVRGQDEALRFRLANYMNHFSSENWADFACNLVPAEQAAELQRHLKECEACRTEYEMWRTVAEIGRKDQNYNPSDGAVRRVKAAYWVLGSQQNKRPVRHYLRFDSFAQPSPAGIRNGSHLSRRLQYQAGPVLMDLDLRRDSQIDDRPMFLVGQFLNAAEPDKPVPNLPVFLLQGRRFVAQAISSELGEFNFQFAEARNWKLAFETGNQEIARISLPDLVPRLPKANS